MTIAVLSDIHANLEALQVALDYIDKNNIKKIYCLGDIVGYGPDPNKCIQLVQERCDVALMGNHDYAAIGLANIEYFNDYAKMSTYWTINTLTENSKEYLRELPFFHQTDNMMMVHASPTNPSFWYYVLSIHDAQIEMKSFNEAMCLIGHSHVPVIYSNKNTFRKTPFNFEPNEKYIVNAGSVGQPRDGNPKTCLTIFDQDKAEVKFVRLKYDVQKTYSKIIRVGLPLFLAERLLKGY